MHVEASCHQAEYRHVVMQQSSAKKSRIFSQGITSFPWRRISPLAWMASIGSAKVISQGVHHHSSSASKPQRSPDHSSQAAQPHHRPGYSCTASLTPSAGQSSELLPISLVACLPALQTTVHPAVAKTPLSPLPTCIPPSCWPQLPRGPHEAPTAPFRCQSCRFFVWSNCPGTAAMIG